MLLIDDGRNDRFFLKYTNNNSDIVSLKMYDIHGILVWEEQLSNSVKEQALSDGTGRYQSYWNGNSFSNEPVKNGIYVYVVLHEGKPVYKGVVTVVR